MRGGADRDENTSESLSLLYCLASSLSTPPSPRLPRLSPELCDRLNREGQVRRRRGGWGSGEGTQDPTRFVSRGAPEPAGVRLCSAGSVSAPQVQSPAIPRPARAGGRLLAAGGKSSLMLPGPLPSGQVCSAIPKLPVWKPLQPQTSMGKVPDGFPLHLAVQCFALLVCKSTK